MKALLLCACLLLAGATACARLEAGDVTNPPPGTAHIRADWMHGSTAVRGSYLGQPAPGDTPRPFAPEILAAFSPWVEALAFSPDGRELFFSVGAADYSRATLYRSERRGDHWQQPEPARFAAGFAYCHEPVYSADGDTLTFTGQRAGESKDLWQVRRERNGEWGVPSRLPAPVNSDADEFRSSVARDGTRYFGRGRSGRMQIYQVITDASGAVTLTTLPAPINASDYDGDPCIAPDGRFLVFYSARDLKSADLYVSFRAPQGGWGEAIKLGPAFNTADDEYGAHLSADGHILFFTRHSSQGNTLFWVDVSAIDRLKPITR